MYEQEIMVGTIEGLNGTAFSTAQPLHVASNVYGSCRAHFPFYVQRFSLRIGTAVNDCTSSIVEMQKVTVGDVTSSLTTMTIPNGATANKVYYSNCTPVKIGVGDKLQFKLKTQGGQGGTPAGTGVLGFYGSLQPENMTNETNAIAL